jgi:hypothetical protein
VVDAAEPRAPVTYRQAVNWESPTVSDLSIQAEPSAYALLTDGTTIEIRAARPGDFAAVRDMHARMSPDNHYLRFSA